MNETKSNKGTETTKRGRKKKSTILSEKFQNILQNFQKEKYVGKEETKVLETTYDMKDLLDEAKEAGIERTIDGSQAASDILSTIDVETLHHNLTPSQYFKKIKELQDSITTESLNETISLSLEILDKLRKTGQKALAEKLMKKVAMLIKEKNASLLGYTDIIKTNDLYVWIHEIETAEREGKKVSAIKVAALEDYMRVIPSDVVDKVSKAKSVFDKFYIVFTDYTGETERHIEQTKQDKDPIIFGAFLTERDNGRVGPSDHLFFIADWEDEYCNLTLTQLIESFRKNTDTEMLISADDVISEKLNEIKKEFKL